MNDERNREHQPPEHGEKKSHSERKQERKRMQEQVKGREAERPQRSGPEPGRKLPLPD